MPATETPALLLDVMSTLVYDPFAVEMPAFFGMSLREMLDAKHPHAWVEFEHGRMDERAFLNSFFADGRRFDHAGFRRAVFEAYTCLPGIEALLADLQQRGVPMYALSNYPCWYKEIEARTGLSRYLSWDFVSCETGHRKPALEAYRSAAAALQRDPSECVFIDDRESNCAAAREVGMRAYRFKDAAGLRKALCAEGLLP